MSWWVYLEDRTAEPYCSYGKGPEDGYERQYVPDGCPKPCYPAVSVVPFSDGGTYVMGGSDVAELNVTYNYSSLFHKVIDGGLRRIHEMPAREAGPILEHAVDMLGTQRDSDYWAPTRGNAGVVLALLLDWAKQRPDAVFRVS